MIEALYFPEIRLLREGLVDRVLPAFAEDAIEREAEAAERETWEGLSALAGPDSDPADLAEDAHHKGIDRYLRLMNLRQALVNLFAVALHHLIEQQQLFLLRRELLSPAEEDEHALLTREEFITRSGRSRVDVSALDGWDDLKELRHVANAVKHAEGSAVAWLRKHRPDLFEPPELPKVAPETSETSLPVYRPLGGEDLYVRESDLDRYFQSALAFWESYCRRLKDLAWAEGGHREQSYGKVL